MFWVFSLFQEDEGFQLKQPPVFKELAHPAFDFVFRCQVEGVPAGDRLNGRSVNAVPRADGASADGFGEGPAWSVPPVITYMIREAGLTPDEAYKTFNMGVGMSVLCAPEDVDRVRELLAAEGLESFVMGECVPGEGKVVYR